MATIHASTDAFEGSQAGEFTESQAGERVCTGADIDEVITPGGPGANKVKTVYCTRRGWDLTEFESVAEAMGLSLTDADGALRLFGQRVATITMTPDPGSWDPDTDPWPPTFTGVSSTTETKTMSRFDGTYPTPTVTTTGSGQVTVDWAPDSEHPMTYGPWVKVIDEPGHVKVTYTITGWIYSVVEGVPAWNYFERLEEYEFTIERQPDGYLEDLMDVYGQLTALSSPSFAAGSWRLCDAAPGYESAGYFWFGQFNPEGATSSAGFSASGMMMAVQGVGFTLWAVDWSIYDLLWSPEWTWENYAVTTQPPYTGPDLYYIEPDGTYHELGPALKNP